MYHDAIAFEIENVTGWNLMQVLAAEMMETTETSVVIESTRGPPDEDFKDNPAIETEIPSTFVPKPANETGLPPSDSSANMSHKLEEVSTSNLATKYEIELPSSDVSTTSTEPATPSTLVPTTIYETALPVSGASALSSEGTRMPFATSKQPDTTSIQVSTAPGKHETSPIVVTATLPDVSTRVVETKLSTVRTKQNETAVRIPVFPTDPTNSSHTAPSKTEPVIVATRSEILTERPSEVGAQEGDKCRTGTHDCSSNGRCIPLDESYDCECNQGFEGDGRICAGMLICFLFLLFHTHVYVGISVKFLLGENVEPQNCL